MTQNPIRNMADTAPSTREAAAEGPRELTAGDLDIAVGGVDAASPKLVEACCKGTHIPMVVIE